MKRPITSVQDPLRQFSPFWAHVLSLFVVFAFVLFPAFNSLSQVPNTDSRGRRWSSMIEPPPPAANWDQLRNQQLTFAEQLREAGVSVEYKTIGQENAGGLVELMPEGMQMAVSLVDGNRIKLELGTMMPKMPGAIEGVLAKVSLEFSSDAPTVSEAGFEGPVSPSTKITGSVRYDQLHDPNWTLGVELQKFFAKFKGEIADGSVNRTVEISLVNLFNSARGIVTAGELPRDLTIKVDTARFYNAIVTSIRQNGSTAFAKGSSSVRGLMVKFDPGLIVAAMRNDQSLLSVRKVVSAVQQKLTEAYPKGVRIAYSDGLLEEMLRNGGSNSGFARLAISLNAARSDTERSSLLADYVVSLRTEYLAAHARPAPREMSLISFKSLVTRAAEYRDRWTELPTDIRRPGGIGRIVGYRLDGDDVIIIGEPASSPEFQLSIDEIVEGVRSGYVRDAVPFCSLDPDPADIGGVQAVRVGGVPENSVFARTMLDADFLMKKIAAGTVTVNLKDFRSLAAIAPRYLQGSERFESMSRFWFSPAASVPGDIELSADGRFVLFSGAMQVLSEQMVNSQEGLVGTGSSDPIASEFAAGFTSALPELERTFPDIGRLHGLFDVVMMTRIWRRLNVNSPWIDRLAELPTATRQKAVYNGINVRIRLENPAGETSLTGGVRMRMPASGRSMMPMGAGQLGSLERTAVPANSIAARVSTDGLTLPHAKAGTSASPDTSIVSRMTALRQFDRAAHEIDRLRSARPFDPEVWCLDAQNLVQQGRFVSAISAASRALELESEDPRFCVWALMITFQSHFMLGENDEALAAIDRLVRSVPDSYRARLARADALAAADRSAEAREEYRAAQRLYPNSYEVYVRFGVFEVSQGFIPTGKALLDRAKRFAATETERASTRSGLALAEIGMAVLGDVDTRLRTGRELAASVIADPVSDPLALLRARIALVEVALATGDIAAAERTVAESQRTLPNNPFLYIALTEWGLSNGKMDIAQKYLSLAEALAPDLPVVRKLRAAIRGKE